MTVPNSAIGKTLPPVAQNASAWLDAASQLAAAGDLPRAKLLLLAVVQAHKQNVQAHVMLVDIYLQLGSTSWPEALLIARYVLLNHPLVLPGT
jgi:hypothetical protein